MCFKLLTIEGEEVVLAEESFGGFSEVLLGIGHRVGAVFANPASRVLAINAVVTS